MSYGVVIKKSTGHWRTDLIIAIAEAMAFVKFMTFGCNYNLLMLGLINVMAVASLVRLDELRREAPQLVF